MRLDSPLALRAGVLGVTAGALTVVQQFVPVLVDAPVGDAAPALFALGAAGLVVSPVLVLAVGYRAGTRRNVAREYGAVAAAFAVGGGVGYLVGYVAAVVALPEGGVAGQTLPLAGSAAYSAVVEAGWFAVAGVAGAAVGQFRTAERNP